MFLNKLKLFFQIYFFTYFKNIFTFSLFLILLFYNKSLSQTETITLLFGGDCTLANHFENYVKDNFDYPFKDLNWFSKADISMVNLENPVSLRGTKIPKTFNFRMPPKYLKVLMNAGIDIVTCANNHSYDYGKDALFDTMRYLDSAGIKYVGIGKNLSEARSSVVFNIKGKKIGFLAYHGGGDWYPATERNAGVVPRFEKYIKEDIEKLRKVDKVDYIIINYHWGKEGSHIADNYQISLAHQTIDFGADIVIGHHPHVLQGIEKYKNGIIVYSLGNFIFGGNSRREYDTMIFKLSISNGIFYPEVIPIHVSSWHAKGLEDKSKEEVIKNVKEYSKIFKNSIFN
jgi:poly-gamma-glutamate capsule biosynthesis protein CapA/YwtB (metallophosphatase superfamily)